MVMARNPSAFPFSGSRSCNGFVSGRGSDTQQGGMARGCGVYPMQNVAHSGAYPRQATCPATSGDSRKRAVILARPPQGGRYVEPRNGGFNSRAGVVKLVDTGDSKSPAVKSVPVRVRPPVPHIVTFQGLMIERTFVPPSVPLL